MITVPSVILVDSNGRVEKAWPGHVTKAAKEEIWKALGTR